jgi:hypothetical protein
LPKIRPKSLANARRDTGIAVHPEDERYKALIGKHVILPQAGAGTRRWATVPDLKPGAQTKGPSSRRCSVCEGFSTTV